MEKVYLFNMFPDYEPPEALKRALSQAAIVAADLDPEEQSLALLVGAEEYIPQRLLDKAKQDIAAVYGLRRLWLQSVHPAHQLQKIEPDELMQMFVSRNSMARGVLAGAKWVWEDTELTIHLVANGKDILAEYLPMVQKDLQEKFDTQVTIRVEAGKALEGKALFEAMENIRSSAIASIPAGAAAPQAEKKAAPPSEAFYGKPFKGTPVAMKDLSMDMGVILVEGRVFAVDHK